MTAAEIVPEPPPNRPLRRRRTVLTLATMVLLLFGVPCGLLVFTGQDWPAWVRGLASAVFFFAQAAQLLVGINRSLIILGVGVEPARPTTDDAGPRRAGSGGGRRGGDENVGAVGRDGGEAEKLFGTAGEEVATTEAFAH